MQVVWSSQNGSKSNGELMETKELTQYFSESLFVPELSAKTKEESFDELAQLFVASKKIRNKEIVLEMLRKRETLGSTGIGKGVAIPHGRTTAAIDVQIAFGRSEAGIEFDAIDKKPVKLIFVVIAPPHDENNRYLPVLGKLVEILHDAAKRRKFMKVTSFEEFLQAIEGEA